MSIDAPKVQDWPAAAVGSMPRAELHGFDDQQPQLLAGTDRAAGGCDQAMGLKVLAPPSLGIEGWRIYALEALPCFAALAMPTFTRHAEILATG